MTIEAMKQALGLICSARLCEVNSMSSRREMLRLMREATDTLRAAIEQADGRKLQRMRQEYWRKTDAQWKDDPELCFALGYDAGYNDAVAPRVEPRASESGAGFESLPASSNQPEPEPVAWRWKELVNDEFDSWVITASEPPPYAVETQPLYTAPRQWQWLTDEEIDELALDENGLPNSHIEFARAIEAKLKEKNHA